MTTAYLRVILSMEILISYAPYRHQRYSSTNSLKRTAVWHGERKCLFPLRIYTALKHGYSQTEETYSLFPLRIYTALKPQLPFNFHCSVCFPYEFTLLSNYRPIMLPRHKFVSPTNLHCSQTQHGTYKADLKFVSPTNLHCSQTILPN